MNVDNDSFLDGNAAAGDLHELFAVDVTAALCRCSNCGRTARVAEVRLYTRAPGLVARCAGCEHVLMRLVRSPERAWIDLRGMSYLEIEMLQ
jgi:xanthine/CO dehydrogenase XdhC/CoxF family maturation factor